MGPLRTEREKTRWEGGPPLGKSEAGASARAPWKTAGTVRGTPDDVVRVAPGYGVAAPGKFICGEEGRGPALGRPG